MKHVLLLMMLAASAMAQQAQPGDECLMDVHRVNTEHGVKVHATLTVDSTRSETECHSTGVYAHCTTRNIVVDSAKYEIETECLSHENDYPCIVPRLGLSSVRYLERNGMKLLQIESDGKYPAQRGHEIVDIQESR